jgi:SAM-dependent methyltransferase
MVNYIIPEEGKPFNLDLACGNRKEEGYIGIDIAKTEAVDYVHDLTSFPYPIDDGVVDSIMCSHFFEHLTGHQRMTFMDECYRILKPGSKMVIICPYWSSMRSVQDPTHQWPPVCEASFLYFNKEWRIENKLDHYPIKCDFDYSYGYALDNDLLVRNIDWQQFAVKHYIQAVNDLQISLTKK